ncbi:hypothetical protein D6833_02065 [Candidatus Parcubacteria bacterium]|nr:MAG: hypothetical protein D6833_02065 [Candidatus Parcubacteria bacterium]
MKTAPRYSPVFGVHAALTLALFAAGLVASVGEKATLRLTVIRVVGILLGASIPWQFFSKKSVCVWAWDQGRLRNSLGMSRHLALCRLRLQSVGE